MITSCTRITLSSIQHDLVCVLSNPHSVHCAVIPVYDHNTHAGEIRGGFWRGGVVGGQPRTWRMDLGNAAGFTGGKRREGRCRHSGRNGEEYSGLSHVPPELVWTTTR